MKSLGRDVLRKQPFDREARAASAATASRRENATLSFFLFLSSLNLSSALRFKNAKLLRTLALPESSPDARASTEERGCLEGPPRGEGGSTAAAAADAGRRLLSAFFEGAEGGPALLRAAAAIERAMMA